MKKVIMILFSSLLLLFTACDEKPEHDTLGTFSAYQEAFAALDFGAMYDLLAKESQGAQTREDYVKLYTELYTGIPITAARMESRMADLDLRQKVYGKDSVKVPVNLILTVQGQELTYSTDVKLIREKDEEGNTNYHVAFAPDLVFQDYKKGDKILDREAGPIRGRILDRNGKVLAGNTDVLWVGMIPEFLGKDKAAAVKELAQALGISETYIQGRLNLSWAKGNVFVDVMKVPLEEQSKLDDLTRRHREITYRKVQDRVYPYGSSAAHLTGYVGLVTKEEYAKLQPLGFGLDAKVGRAGLELLYDEVLRGQKGVEKVLVDQNGVEKRVLTGFQTNRGQDLILTIDADKQLSLYQAMAGSAGTGSVVNYKTGEIEAWVSLPAYDPNGMILGIPSIYYEVQSKDPGKPLLNRFTRRYAPGSTIKPITAAIALDMGGFDPEFTLELAGTKWQKEAAWGNYFITRKIDPLGPVDLEKAMILSDNIYFAQMTLEMGEATFRQGLLRFGVGEDAQPGYPLEISQVANTDTMNSEILLADSGYGQGQVLFNSLTLPRALTAIADGGKLKSLRLLFTKNPVEQKAVLSEATAQKILGYMEKVVTDPQGTGYAARMEGYTFAGKTGTSEVGSGSSAQENSWLTLINRDPQHPSIVTMMVENTKDLDGSGLMAGKMKTYWTSLPRP